MSRAYPEPGEKWKTRRRVDGFRYRVVEILGIREVKRNDELIGTGYVDYKYTSGPNARLNGSHKLATFVQRYERIEE